MEVTITCGTLNLACSVAMAVRREERESIFVSERSLKALKKPVSLLVAGHSDESVGTPTQLRIGLGASSQRRGEYFYRQRRHSR